MTKCLSALLWVRPASPRTVHCSCYTTCYELQSLAHSEHSFAVTANSGVLRLSEGQGPKKSNGHQQTESHDAFMGKRFQNVVKMKAGLHQH